MGLGLRHKSEPESSQARLNGHLPASTLAGVGRWVGSLSMGCKAHRRGRELLASGAPFVLSVVLVSKVKSYDGAKGREKEQPGHFSQSAWSPGAGGVGMSCCWHRGPQRGERPGEEEETLSFPGLQMELAKILVQVY